MGRLRGGPLQALLDDYGKRLGGGPLGPLTVKEVEERRALPAPALKAREGKLLLKALPKHARLIALDEGGRSLDSRGFAALLGRWHEEGVAATAFATGRADGLAEALRPPANLTLSLGALLAAPPGAFAAGRTALPRQRHPPGPPLSPGLKTVPAPDLDPALEERDSSHRSE